MEETLTISKVKTQDRFQFIGLDICALEDSTKISMEDYVQSLEDVVNIRKADCDDDLMRMEIKEYIKMTRKLGWLTNSTRPHLSYTALQIFKKIIMQQSWIQGE